MRRRLGIVIVTGWLGAAGCGGPANAPAAPAGFFPTVYSEVAFVSGAHLLGSAAVPGSTTQLRFHAVASKATGWALVVRCYVGNVRINEGGGDSRGPCRGTAGVIAGCAGGINEKLTVQVDRRQPSSWGIALYRSSCPPVTPAEILAKAPPLAKFTTDPGHEVRLPVRSGRGSVTLQVRGSRRTGVTVLVACSGINATMPFQLGVSFSAMNTVRCDGSLQRSSVDFHTRGISVLRLVTSPVQQWRIAIESP